MTFNPTYYNTIDQIYHASFAIEKLARIELMRRLIGRLWPEGHPTRMIHVAGTSGKGSVCRFLEAGLGMAGKAGGYYSPHLFDYRERFSIGGQAAAQDDITAAWEQTVKPLCLEMALQSGPSPLTFPEISLLVALVLFEQHGVDWAAMETGLGGRYDQTRALDVAATLVTNVGRDHEAILGSQHWQRALDKAGICRAGVPCFTADNNPETLDTLQAICDNLAAPLQVIAAAQIADFEAQLERVSGGGLPEDVLLNAEHQHQNATLSLSVLRHLFPGLDADEAIKRFAEVRFPGRFWAVEVQGRALPNVYADIAHNPDKIAALAQQIDQRFGERGKIFVLGASRQRASRQLYTPLIEQARSIILAGQFYLQQPAEEVRAALGELPEGITVLLAENPRRALEMATGMQTDDDVVILTGSAYMIEQALNPDPYLRHINLTFGWRNQPPR